MKALLITIITFSFTFSFAASRWDSLRGKTFLNCSMNDMDNKIIEVQAFVPESALEIPSLTAEDALEEFALLIETGEGSAHFAGSSKGSFYIIAFANTDIDFLFKGKISKTDFNGGFTARGQMKQNGKKKNRKREIICSSE